jgi:photosystem II stability/assembly factor-like uncharacterized protein
MISHIPLSFEARRGPDQRAKFISRLTGCNIALTDEGASIARRGEEMTLKMKIIGADMTRIIGADEASARANYFLGNDPEKWKAGTPLYSKVRYEQVYPGIDLVYYGRGQELEYDFQLAPGADFRAIRFRFDGAKAARLIDGELRIETRWGEIRNRRPVAYQEADGERKEVESAYALGSQGEVSFRVGEYDATRPLIIDPVLTFSTYLGGSNLDIAEDIAIDSSGNIYITGWTESLDFPAMKGRPAGEFLLEAFAAKLHRSGSLMYATFLGGTSVDRGYSIAVDTSGNAYITGETSSGDFPTTIGAFQTGAPGGINDAFITKLDPAGNLFYSTYLGGSAVAGRFEQGSDTGLGIAVDSDGNAFVTGQTNSLDFPTKRALQSALNEGRNPASASAAIPPPIPIYHFDAFVTKINREGSNIVFSTYLGGFEDDRGRDIAVDESSGVYVAGDTFSDSFPVHAALQSRYGGSGDGFVVRIKPSGREFVYSTFLGGIAYDAAHGLAIDSSGNAYVAGHTGSSDFPATDASAQNEIADSPLYKSDDGGMTWSNFRNDLPSGSLTALAIDRQNRSTLYAGISGLSQSGIYKSTDGGARWQRALEGDTAKIIIDPNDSANLFARGSRGFGFGAEGRVSRSTDGGTTWSSLSTPSALLGVADFNIDPRHSSTLYATLNLCPIPVSGNVSAAGRAADAEPPSFYKSIDGGDTWIPLSLSFSCLISSILVDSKTTSTLYAQAARPFKSTDGGDTWNELKSVARILAVDPVNTTTVYGMSSPDFNLLKSTDGGTSWNETGLSRVLIDSFFISPSDPSVLLAGVNRLNQNDGATSFFPVLLRSSDGGATWSETGFSGITVRTLAIDPIDPMTVFAGADTRSDAFAMKIGAAGALIYSTFIGGRGTDQAAAIAVDKRGNAYVAGHTFSESFPLRDALQQRRSSPVRTAAFVSKIDPQGQSFSYSTYLGGSSNDQALAIAVDSSGKVYVAGNAQSADFPTVSPLQASNAGLIDAFIARISTPGKINNVSIKGKKLLVEGEGFDAGAVILVDGQEQKTTNKSESLLVGKKAAGKIAPGQTALIRVRNSDSLLSEVFRFTRAQ